MKSPFWTYFHDKLNWLPIFKPGPVSAIMKGLALHMDEVRHDILWLREQWNPVTCEEDLVAKYGQSRGILRNRFDTDASYRKRVVSAFIWHKKGGKIRGLEQILLESGFNTEVLPASKKELWAHFRLLLHLENILFAEAEASLFCHLALEYKAARSVIEVIMTRSIREVPVNPAVSLASRLCLSTRLWLYPERASKIYECVAAASYVKTTFSPSTQAPPKPAPVCMTAAMSTVIFTRSEICPINL